MAVMGPADEGDALPVSITCEGSVFTFGELLGQGGFAKCYLVTAEDGREFACKVILKKRLDAPQLRDKLASEIAIHRECDHPYIVRFVQTTEDAKRVYIMLEKCSQRTLHEMMQMRKRISEREAARILAQLVSAVRYLHARRVIHRDIKLSNLFVHASSTKLGDFGLAAHLEADDDRRTTMCGTPNYLAPEMLRKGEGHSYPVDAWAIGVVLYALLCGRAPFDAGGDVKRTYSRIRSACVTFPDSAELTSEARDLIK
ncbi:putative calcium-dependent protein kinase, partial [Pavlovales sp. CCMP2436]